MPASETPPSVAEPALRSRWRAFGPGLLFAGAAVGVSHIVQSTRGGAAYGTGALLIIVLSCLVKWPAFRFGSLYAAVTGESLLAGYRRQGRWVLAVFALLTLAIIFTTLAAVTVVSAGLLMNLFPHIAPSLEGMGLAPQYHAIMVSALLLLGTTVLLIRGYRWLERIMKVVMPVLAIATLAATVISLFRISASDITLLPAINDAKDVELTAGIIGWMPAPIDIAVWTSLWALARARRPPGTWGRGCVCALTPTHWHWQRGASGRRAGDASGRRDRRSGRQRHSEGGRGDGGEGLARR